MAWQKYKRDQAMTLAEHAITSGYGYSSLKELALPLIKGKITPTDLRRILRRRQDQIEAERFPSPINSGPIGSPQHPQLTADKLRAPR